MKDVQDATQVNVVPESAPAASVSLVSMTRDEHHVKARFPSNYGTSFRTLIVNRRHGFGPDVDLGMLS